MSSMSKVRAKSIFWSEMSQRILEILQLVNRSKNVCCADTNWYVSDDKNVSNIQLFNFIRMWGIGLAIQLLKTCCLLSTKSKARPALMPIEKKTWTLENWAQVSRYESQARDQCDSTRRIELIVFIRHLNSLLWQYCFITKVIFSR